MTITEEIIQRSWQEKRDAHALTLAKTISLIWSDSRQKRIQMSRSQSAIGIFLGLFSINVVAIALWRISMWLIQKQWVGWNILAKLIYFANIILFSFDASPYSTVGPGFVVAHLVGCTLHAKFGKNCILYGRNGLGGLGYRAIDGWLGGPIFEDGVVVGYGASVLGPVTIGRNATIGAGAWCFHDVPENGVTFGMPAKLHRIKTPEECELERVH